MSLLGRLEDLSLTDIVQIVFLSRRTGILEIIDSAGRHTVLFRHGLIVNASAPDHPDLITFLQKRRSIPADAARIVRQMEDNGIPCGSAVVEMNLVSADDLGQAIRERILDVVTPLLQSRDGEFNFILSDAMTGVDMEYEPDSLFKEGGFAPQKIVGGDGEKIKPLRGLEESLKAGKALLRSASTPEPAPSSLNVVPFPIAEETPHPPAEASSEPLTAETAAAPQGGGPPYKASTGQFKVAGGLFEIESPDATYRNVILLERDPLVRVAAKRAFAKQGVKTFQFGTIDDVRSAMTDLFQSKSFFVSFLELTGDEAVIRLLQQLKRRNPRLPVVTIDRDADLRRRHDLLKAGVDLYLTKPSQARLQPGLADEELALFADELVLFAERCFYQWEKLTGGFGQDAGKRFYEIGNQESVDRSFGLLKQLINELSNPNDISQVAATILRVSGEYVDRGALFVATEDEFVGLGGFGEPGATDGMDARIRTLRIQRGEPSVLADVASSGAAHHGKMHRTAANVRLIEQMGNLLPTEVAVLPVMQGGRTIGILYGDNAEHRAPIDSMTGLEIFLSQAGYAFGNAVNAWRKSGRAGS